MSTNSIPQSGATRLLVWWLLWAGILAGLMAIAVAVGQRPASAPVRSNVLTDFIGLGPLLASCLLRWLVLPRVRQVQSAFVVFVLGLVLAEACGLSGIFLSTFKNELLVLGVLGLGQWMPRFARGYIESSAADFRSAAD